MQLPASNPTRHLLLRHLILILLAGGALAACDKHSAQEVPESYGHGSAHASAGGKSYDDHGVDSGGGKHYSDTQGTVEKKSGEGSAAKASPAPASTPSGHFF